MTVPVWASQLQGRSGAYAFIFFKEVMTRVCFLEPIYANLVFHFFPLTLQ